MGRKSRNLVRRAFPNEVCTSKSEKIQFLLKKMRKGFLLSYLTPTRQRMSEYNFENKICYCCLKFRKHVGVGYLDCHFAEGQTSEDTNERDGETRGAGDEGRLHA